MGKWIRSLVGLKAPPSSASAAGKGRKWSRLWRSTSSSSCRSSGAAGCETSSSASPSAGAVATAVVRAPTLDFRVIRREWAAVRIQAAFRALLARRALKALRGIVRLQALVRGRLVRRQLAVTLTRMEALLRVQERAMERRARSSADALAQEQDALTGRADPLRETEEQWCDRLGSVNQVKSRMHMKHEGALKRQRAIAYAHSHQHRSLKYSARLSSPARSLRNHEFFVEGWMATKPWESGHMSANLGESRRQQSYEEMMSLQDSNFSDAGSIKMRRNNDYTTTRVEAMPPPALSASSSDFASTSSITPVSATNTLASEARFDSGRGGGGGPGYMSLTKAAKARLDDGGGGGRRGQFQLQRQRSGGVPYYNRRVALSSLDSESNAGSDVSAAARRLNGLSLKGQSMTRSLDKENENWF